jgi:hypothetical protein
MVSTRKTSNPFCFQMKKTVVFAVCLASALVIEAQGVFLSAGQSLEYSFSSLSPIGPVDVFPGEPTEVYSAGFTWTQGTFPTGSLVTLSLFENSTSQVPFRTADLQGNTPSSGAPVVLNGIGLIGLDDRDAPVWQDFQGVLLLSVTSGSIAIESLSCETVVGGIRYGGSLPIPEPSEHTLLFLMFSCLLLWKNAAVPLQPVWIVVRVRAWPKLF